MALGDPYATRAELVAFLRMTATGNDAQLDLAVGSASEWIEAYCRRQFNLAASATARYFDTTNAGTVLVDDIGNLTGLAIATDTSQDGTYGTTWAASDFQAGPLEAIAIGEPVYWLNAIGSYTYPPVTRRQGLVRVTARWGWPAVPDAVKEACLIQAARIYKRRESAEGVLGFGEFGPVRVGSRLDPDVQMLLEHLRLAPRVYAG